MKKYYVLPGLLLMIFLIVSNAEASLNINIQRGSNKSAAIAITGFLNAENMDIASVVAQDLDSCDGFRVVEEQKYPENIGMQDIPKFNAWKALGVDAILVGEINRKDDGSQELSYRLWDTVMKKQLSGKAIKINKDNWRRVAHIVSDNTYQAFTGDRGHFDTKIAYIAEFGPQVKRIKRLAIMDQDGANHQYLTDGNSLILTPRFSPDGESIIYMAYIQDNARLYIKNIATGQERAIADFRGISSAPRFSPDGDTVIMAISHNGHTNIHAASLKTSKAKQLTKYHAISTSPSYSPDGKQIAFASDRSGKIQLYTMNHDGSGIKRISFGKGTYSAPSWSPRGDYIAFTKSSNGNFYIGIIKPDGSGERILAKGYMVEGANWSPNGRMIIFNKQEKTGIHSLRTKNRIMSIDIVSGKERILPTMAEGTDPTWSPFLP